MTDVISPVWGFAISHIGFFSWCAVRPSAFVWPGLKVTTAAAEDEAAAADAAYLSQMCLCCSWKCSIAE